MNKNKENKSLSDRQIWATTRSVIEARNFKHKPDGKKSRSRWPLFVRILKLFKPVFKASGLYRRGYGNTMRFRIAEHEVVFEDLPKAFDGFRILFLTDLHLDTIPGFELKIIERLQGLKYDLCLMGGDYRMANSGSFKRILRPMKNIADAINAEYGIYAVLGNHDTWMMSDYQEMMGVELLINENAVIRKNGQQIIITGTDDPFRYYTDQALQALEKTAEGFKIALVHTSELSGVASENHYQFYLCGHTHGGQICLPGGIPIITHQNEGRNFIRGFWKQKQMQGYTSPGVGVSGLPVRFYCPGEMTIFTFRRKGGEIPQ